MSRWTLIWQSLWHHRRIHIPVLVAVAIATAVITGALVVGDSVRESLRHLALERLGKIDEVLVSHRFFSQSQAAALSDEQVVSSACILVRSTAQTSGNQTTRRVRNVTLIGFDDTFWQLNEDSTKSIPIVAAGTVVINRALANELGVRVDDQITIRLPDANQVQADSALGRKDDRIRSLAGLTVAEILPDRGLGKFSLHPTQQTTFNAFVPIATAQKALDVPQKANALLVANPAKTRLDLELSLEDFGISVQRVTQEFEGRKIFDYFNLSSDQMIWDAALSDALADYVQSLDGQEVFTYLANAINKTDGDTPADKRASIPYSTVTALNNNDRLGPIAVDALPDKERLGDDEIVLNSWAAAEIAAEVGDTIEIGYFQPETTHGEAVESTANFRLVAITPLTEPETPFRRNRDALYSDSPTQANDPDLTPTVAGVTDQQSISDWDPPFPFDSKRIQPADDDYWENHRTTPKAFISLAAGQRIWQSRFGRNTSFRIPADAVDEATLRIELTKRLQSRYADVGFAFRPIRAEAISASTGTTPFEFLFLGFSFFLIAAALALIGILFRLGIDLRLKEFGTLVATGWTRHDLRITALGETSIVAGLGSFLGVALGVCYAASMLYGLRTYWVAAVVTPFMRLFVMPWTLATGLILGLLTAILVVWLSLRGLRQVTPTRLLAGQASPGFGDVDSSARRSTRWRRMIIGMTFVAFGMLLSGRQATGEAQAGLFFGSGAAILCALLCWLRLRFRDVSWHAASNQRLGDWGFAWRSAARNPGRSTLTVSLMAAATFLIVAISAFRIAPSESGTGGFLLIAESDRPLHHNFFDESVRIELFGNAASQLADVDILGLRVHGGDDASCRNLYQATQPRLIGVSQQMQQYFDSQKDAFAWAGNVSGSDNPWRCLDRIDGESIPIVIDKNTAMYALHLPPRIGHEFELIYDDQPQTFRIAGLLSNTLLQGALILSEDDLVRLAPTNSGYNLFLVRQHPDSASERKALGATVTNLLEERFSDEGLDARQTDRVLADLLAVQNTYLSTFQSLGALGLLLGTIGLAAVQIRNVIARKSEMGLLRALGFGPIKLRKQIVLENLSLLFSGLAIGVFAALVTVVPHWLAGAAGIPIGSLLPSWRVSSSSVSSPVGLPPVWEAANPSLRPCEAIKKSSGRKHPSIQPARAGACLCGAIRKTNLVGGVFTANPTGAMRLLPVNAVDHHTAETNVTLLNCGLESQNLANQLAIL